MAQDDCDERRIDPLSIEERSERMRLVKARDSKAEIAVRQVVYSLGYRYRLHKRELPGCPDLVFAKSHKVIFVHGCFWHRHNCSSGKRLPKTHLSFWGPKLESNKIRDQINLKKLRKLGWNSLIIWECEVQDKDKLRKKIVKFLGSK